MTRLELETSIYAYLHRANFRTPVANFDAVKSWVALGEQDVNLDLRARCMIRRVSQTVDAAYLPLPCDYIEAEDLRLSTGRQLVYRDRQQIGDMLQVQNGAPPVSGMPPHPTVVLPYLPTGPLYYSVVGDLMELWPYAVPTAPLPDGWQPTTLEMAYFQAQSLGPADTDTTPVLTALPGAYLWGALKYSAPFLRDDGRTETWANNYNAIVAKSNLAKERAASAGSRLVQSFRRVG
jgi:hypothetical protein